MWDTFLEKITAWCLSAGISLLTAAVIILVGWWITKLICKALGKIFEKGKVDPGAGGFILSVCRVVLIGIAVLAAVGQMVNINSLIAALGAAGLTASFALQGSLGNFVSGMQIIFPNPFPWGIFWL